MAKARCFFKKRNIEYFKIMGLIMLKHPYIQSQEKNPLIAESWLKDDIETSTPHQSIAEHAKNNISSHHSYQ